MDRSTPLCANTPLCYIHLKAKGQMTPHFQRPIAFTLKNADSNTVYRVKKPLSPPLEQVI